MNCDQVFDALTRGPFPTGNDSYDERVERHLAHCDSCRRLAAALQPAVELFEEAVSPEESCGLPAYWGELFVQGDSQPATRTRQRQRPSPSLRRRARRQRIGFRLEHAWRISAALLIGLAVGGVMRAALEVRQQPTTPTAPGDRDHNFSAARWRALGMTVACGPMALAGGGPDRARADSAREPASGEAAAKSNKTADPAVATLPADQSRLARQKCCTDCHHANSAVIVSPPARERIASSCQLCHAGSSVTAVSASRSARQ